MRNEPKRYRTVSLVLLLLIVLGFIQAAKVVALREQSALLLDLQVRPDPRLRMLIATVWMVVFWVLAIALWRRIALTRWLVPLIIALHVVYETAILGLFAKVSINSGRWFLYSVMAIALVSFTFWALNRRSNNTYFWEDKPVEE
jgi:hypothetical protein